VLVVEVILAQSIDAPIVIMRKLLSENLLIGQKHWLKRHKRMADYLIIAIRFLALLIALMCIALIIEFKDI